MVERRRFLKMAAWAGAAGLAAGSLPWAAGQEVAAPGRAGAGDAGRRPNIILILADDLGYGDIGAFGQKLTRTPNLDRLAQEGMRFTQHYVGVPVCAPSRACLFTGLHSGHTAMRANGTFELPRDPEAITVARLLKDAGYRTGMVGKSGLQGNSTDVRLPHDKGFDHFFGFVSHTAAHHYFPPEMVRNGEIITYPGNSRHEGDAYSCDLFVKDATAFIEAAQDGPFFLQYATQLPHLSLYAPDAFRDPYRGKFAERPVKAGHYRGEPEPNATWAGMVSRLDWEVGQIVAKVRELKLEENTLIIFASDNGAMVGAQHDAKLFESNGIFRGGKRDMYEGGIRTPMIAWWPGQVESGSSSAHVSAFWDFMPTVCEIAGVKAPAGIDGISYAPTLLGRAGQREHPYLYWELYEGGGRRAVRFGNWKAVQYNVLGEEPRAIEVYDLAADPRESQDIAADRPELVTRAAELMREAHVPLGPWKMPAPASGEATR